MKVKRELELRLERVSKSWHGFALKDVTMEVADGEYFALLGPNGAGKTLLLETILGFWRPDKGRILLNGKDVTSVPPEKRGFGYVPQNCMLFPHMKVRQNVEFGLKMRRVSENERRKTSDQVLELLGLKALANRLPVMLSGGERQKVALARVLAIEPEVVLLDEPLASIDQESSRVMKEELKRIHRDLKVTVVHVTHNQIEAFSLAKRVAIMHQGQILQIDGAKSVLSNPASEFVARFLGYENIFKGKLVKRAAEQSTIDISGFIVKTTSNVEEDECVVGIRPEDFALSVRPPPTFSTNVLRGIIADWEDLGPIVSVSVDAAIKVKVTVSKGSFLELSLDRRTEVWLSFRPESVKLLSQPKTAR
jgi:molybdate/tungstate transport system ATP-binding protein